MRRLARPEKFYPRSLVPVLRPLCSSHAADRNLWIQKLQLAFGCLLTRWLAGRLPVQVGKLAWLKFCESPYKCGPTTAWNRHFALFNRAVIRDARDPLTAFGDT